ncbi:MAG TPA: Dyp-type peroxidase [Allosphingosinicella sp.]|nr:Dyp-type peroxidase [Allosphingosinicella sp.]
MTDASPKLVERPLPCPLFGRRFQGGITDPIWPSDCETVLGGDADPAVRDRYANEYSGRLARQDFLTILRADILSADRGELRDILKLLTRFVVEETRKGPSKEHVAVLETVPSSYRVTVTLGLGSTLFVDRNGEDRFGLRARRPRCLKPMPSFPGDHGTLDCDKSASDIIIAIASDHPYVNTAVARFFGEFFNKHFTAAFQKEAEARPMLRFRTAEQGFGRKDKREFLRFDDGIQNLQMSLEDLERLIYAEPTDGEPDWCVDGSYMVYRKIREDMPTWEGIAAGEQERMIGRRKDSGLPLSRQSTGTGGFTPVFAHPADALDGPFNAHVRKVQPRRNRTDLFGLDDLERQFLRRPYPYFEGFDDRGRSINGLHFVAFMKNIQQQFEHVTNMWQMNPDFPAPGAGLDVLYAKGILSTVDGGYYFCPPGLKDESDYFASGMLE